MTKTIKMFLLTCCASFLFLLQSPKALAQADAETADFTYASTDLGCPDGQTAISIAKCKVLAQAQAKLDIGSFYCGSVVQIYWINYEGTELPDGTVVGTISLSLSFKRNTIPACTG